MSRHTNDVQRSRLTSNDAMMLWRAREAYRAQTCLSSLVRTPFVLLARGALLVGEWGKALVFLGVPVVALRALGWVGRRMWTRLRAAWHQHRGGAS